MPAQMDAGFGAVAAAPDRTGVDEGDLYALTCRRNRGAHTGHAAAHNDEVILHLADLAGVDLVAELGQSLAAGGRDYILVGGDPDGIAAAVEARPVVQGDLGRAVRQICRTGILPLPLRALASERGIEVAAADRYGECSRAALVGPRRGPVIGAHVDVVLSCGGYRHLGRGIPDGASHAVRYEIRRAHLEGELLIDAPAALDGKVLGLDPY